MDEHARGAELAQVLCALEEEVGLSRWTGAMDEPNRELLLARVNRLGRFAEIREVVQRVVETEDVDPGIGRALDEPPNEVTREWPLTDEESASKGDAEGP